LKVLVIGSGGREHALAWKIAGSPRVRKLYCAPGNAGIASQAECVDLPADDIPALLGFAMTNAIDLTVVGPEAPLAAGIVDEFAAADLRIFGPTRAAAQIEASKSFCKQLLERWKIPTAKFDVFGDAAAAKRHVDQHGAPIVVKADGLAAGKGVVVAATIAEAHEAIDRILVQQQFGAAGARIVIEECLTGQECSLIAITDGNDFVTLAPAQDYKRIRDNDEGPNTGGMGSYSPVPAFTADDGYFARELILKPTLQALRCEGIDYCGALYAGLMLTSCGPKVVEFNCRFGDPETQAVLPRMESDLVDLLLAATEGTVKSCRPQWKRAASVCVVMASGGYPGDFARGKLIDGLDAVSALEDVVVFHAGTTQQNGNVATSGGRVLGVTAVGADYGTAVARAYEAAGKIQFEGAHYRSDIGKRVSVISPHVPRATDSA
jgi:phosphoribosylamine--glycine ligase